MPSTLSWLDHDPNERSRSQRILALFQEKASRDELGLGALRDGLADHLFPGTSTIQTRPRYTLLVAWMYRFLEEKETPSARMADEGRKLETSLISALLEGGETDGLIGKRARSGLKRLPSSVYWNGLGSWGIRLFQGSQGDYHAFADTCYRLRHGRRRLREEETDLGGDRTPLWMTWRELPTPPVDLFPKPKPCQLSLGAEEAEYLAERILHSCGHSLLADLVRRWGSCEADNIWTHPHFGSFRPEHQRQVRHARLFSLAMHPAAILYNLMLSHIAANQEYVARNDARWGVAMADFPHEEIARWDLNDFFEAASHPNHNVSPRLRTFVEQWVGYLRRHGKDACLSPDAQALVGQREQYLKGGRSRFTNPRAREATWTGDAGASAFDFRWRVTRLLLDDLWNARESHHA